VLVLKYPHCVSRNLFFSETATHVKEGRGGMMNSVLTKPESSGDNFIWLIISGLIGDGTGSSWVVLLRSSLLAALGYSLNSTARNRRIALALALKKSGSSCSTGTGQQQYPSFGY